MRDDRIHVYLIDLDLPPEAIDDCRELLDAAERIRAQRFVHRRHRDRWTAARAGLRRVLAEHCAVPPRALKLSADAGVKPVLVAPAAAVGLHFSLSHSGDLALVAVTGAAPVGADIEHRRELPRRDAIVERFFAPAERNAYRRVPPGHSLQAFYNAWTRKEAVAKATGEGVAAAFDRFAVSLAPDEPARVLTFDGQPVTGWQLFHLEPRSDCTGAAAIRAPVPVRLSGELRKVRHGARIM